MGIFQKKENYMDKKTSAAIKGVAILMMMMHHHFGSKGNIEHYGIVFAPFPPYLIDNVRVLCKICVSLFAFVSGYGLFLSYRSFDRKRSETDGTYRWVAVRYMRTMSGYWAVYILSAVVCQLINGLTFRNYFGKGRLQGIVNMVIDFFGLGHFFGSLRLGGSWWYMTAAVTYIILTPLLFDMQKKHGAVFTLAAVIAVPRLLQINELGSTNSILGFLFVFVLGMSFAKCDIINKWISCELFRGGAKKSVKFLIELALLFVCYKLYMQLSELRYWELLWGVIPAFAVLFLTEFILPIRGINDILAFLGKHSLNIYLVHHFVKRVYLADFVHGFKHFALVLLMTTLISLVISLVIEGLKKLVRYEKLIDLMVKKVEVKG